MPIAQTNAAPAAPIDDRQRHHLIEVAAYYLAEQRGFDADAGSSHDDWLAAEREIDALIAAGRLSN